jgi:diguanylate cyclase (GGDEF)-like protein/PAS domain S-box-containing protein
MDPPFLLIILLSFVFLNAICLFVIFLLWRRIHGRFSGTGLWLIAYLAQFTGIGLIILRDFLPEAVPILIGNSLVLGGMILLLAGLERFVGREGSQIHNVVLWMAFLAGHAYLFFSAAGLAARNVNITIALLLIFGQCAWLLFIRADPEMRSITRGPAWICIGFCLTAVFRITANIILPSGIDFFRSNPTDLVSLITFQMLFIGLTFSLSLMVNLRLAGDLEHDNAMRMKAETLLRESEEKFSTAFHSSPDAILISPAGGDRLLEVNESFCRLSGYSREEALSSALLPRSLWVSTQDEQECSTLLETQRRVRNHEYVFRTKSGSLLDCLYSGEIILLAGEAYILSIVSDITERKRAEQVLQRSEANFREVFENSAQGIFILDVLVDGNFQIRESNRAQEKISGVAHKSVDGKLLEEAFSPMESQILQAKCLQCLETAAPVSMEEGFDTPSGRKFVHATLAPVRDESGRIYRIIGSTLDISARKWADETLRLRLTLWEYAAEHTVEELMQKALDEIEGITNSPVSFYHFVLEDETSLSLQAWSTRTQREFCRADIRGMHYNLDEAGVWAECIRKRKPVIHNEYSAMPGRRGLPKDHGRVVRELVVPTFHGDRIVAVLGIGNKSSPYTGQDAELLSSIADIIWVIVDHKRTEEEILALQKKLEEMAVHDSLTGLYNRHYLDVTLKRELARAAREKYPVSFVMIDIDRFKDVNDTFGHKAGDAVLQNLASLLMENSRASDIIFRYGGEEFLAVLPKVKVELAFQIAEKWRKGFLESTLLLGYGGVKATISCGIAAFPKHGATGTDLIANADQALYQAKSAGRNRSEIWMVLKQGSGGKTRKPRLGKKAKALPGK